MGIVTAALEPVALAYNPRPRPPPPSLCIEHILSDHSYHSLSPCLGYASIAHKMGWGWLMNPGPLAYWTILCALAIVRSAMGGNTTCLLSQPQDWYTDAIGETPCRTYERLRQLCDSACEKILSLNVPTLIGFVDQVGDFGDVAPGDKCDSQNPTCCCNSIAWQLSMLCLK